MESVINKILYVFGLYCIMLAVMLLAGWGDLTPPNISTKNNLIVSFVIGISGLALIWFNPLTIDDFCKDIDKD